MKIKILANVLLSTFHISTFAVWKVSSIIPRRKPDFISESGSKYWYGGVSGDILKRLLNDTDGSFFKTLSKEDRDRIYIVRQSDHWCHGNIIENDKYYVNICKSVASCKWYLSIPITDKLNTHSPVGICKLKNFKKRLNLTDRKRYNA